MPIFRSIRQYFEKKPSVWHTPGHKGKLSPYDITEIDDSFPAQEITDAQQRAATLFGAKHVRFLTGGSSIGIKAGLLSLPGAVLIEKNCHQAVREGLRLSGKRVVEIANKKKNGLDLPLSPQDIEAALRTDGEIKTVVVTSPDYYGQTCDCIKIYETVKKYGAFLYADSAHGAHFAVRKDLFPRGFTDIADVCNISAHKTLMAFTQSAYLCINNDELIEKIDESLTLLGTTSPSYILLAGLDYAVDYSLENSGGYDALRLACDRLRKKVKCLENNDFSRVVVDAQYYGLGGGELYYKLKKEGIVCERFDSRYVIIIVSIADSEEKIDALCSGILKAAQGRK